MTESARYLYAISRALDPATLASVTGLRGSGLDVVRHRGLDAVVGDVPLEEFGEDGLRQHLEDLAWLEEVARGHDDVVRAVAEQGPTAPLRLATICLDDDAVRVRLEEWHADLTAVLDRVEGRAEWSVKVIAPPGGSAPDPAPTTGMSGAEFLRQRKERNESREQHTSDATRLAEQVHAELAATSVASRVLAPQDPQLTGHTGVMVLNGAYLVDVERGQAFAVLVEELATAHAQLQVEGAGPWPPYSFAVLEQP